MWLISNLPIDARLVHVQQHPHCLIQLCLTALPCVPETSHRPKMGHKATVCSSVGSGTGDCVAVVRRKELHGVRGVRARYLGLPKRIGSTKDREGAQRIGGREEGGG